MPQQWYGGGTVGQNDTVLPSHPSGSDFSRISFPKRDGPGNWLYKPPGQGGTPANTSGQDQPTQLPPFFGGTGTSGNSAGNIEVDTSVNPTGVYSNQQTREGQNLAHAQAMQSGNPAGMIQNYTRPGISAASPALLSQMVPEIAGAYGAGQQAVQSLPFQDAMANAQQLLSGQVAREQEGLGMAGVLGGLNLAQQRAGLQQQGGLLSFLQQLLGG